MYSFQYVMTVYLGNIYVGSNMKAILLLITRTRYQLVSQASECLVIVKMDEKLF